ncbi:hypothetical protein B4135_2179 [Caldibacillus debilis]|uniref:Uncharacterized protein n=1 Tax=Caldibacillus debilis TaxID=301148 RepID=A0A150M4C7_9BACI|nr:hypothetical protein B4135_2179 [Caldibacillus debilis]
MPEIRLLIPSPFFLFATAWPVQCCKPPGAHHFPLSIRLPSTLVFTILPFPVNPSASSGASSDFQSQHVIGIFYEKSPF